MVIQKVYDLFPNMRDVNSETALMIAVRKLRDIPQFLLTQLRQQTITGVTALMIAASTGNQKFVEQLLYEQKMQTRNGETALFFAIYCHNWHCIQLLLDESQYQVQGLPIIHYMVEQSKFFNKKCYSSIINQMYIRIKVQFESYPVKIEYLNNKHTVTNQDINSKYILRKLIYQRKNIALNECEANYFQVGFEQYYCLIYGKTNQEVNDVFGRTAALWCQLSTCIQQQYSSQQYMDDI
ncbi:Ankyrin_repeat protein [Hexamita inflata]|uniref:Ankyrin repeat protein n=1 Tax=Hexamita inflata TaxID=28002 RepID=A0AA86RIX0_9EUKA|nr:Ankyrin repeat protein [Hexamita inflata]